jgi:hypothetical protein
VCEGEATIVLGVSGQPWVQIWGPLGGAPRIGWDTRGRVRIVAHAITAAYDWLDHWSPEPDPQPSLFDAEGAA